MARPKKNILRDRYTTLIDSDLLKKSKIIAIKENLDGANDVIEKALTAYFENQNNPAPSTNNLNQSNKDKELPIDNIERLVDNFMKNCDILKIKKEEYKSIVKLSEYLITKYLDLADNLDIKYKMSSWALKKNGIIYLTKHK